MISLSERITIPSPPDLAWPLLSDPAIVASCIPGATLTAPADDGAYIGTVRVKFGPTVALFRGEARLAYDHAARRCTIDGRGIAGRGQSRAVAFGVVNVSGANETVLQVEGSFNVTGPLEAFANAGGVHVARALLAAFAANMARLIAAEGVPAPEADAIPMIEPQTPTMQARAAVHPAGGAELRSAGLLWRAFMLWLRQAFSRMGQRVLR